MVSRIRSGALALLLALVLLAPVAIPHAAAADSFQPPASEATPAAKGGLTAGRSADQSKGPAASGPFSWFSRAVFWVQMQQSVFNRQLAGNVSKLSQGFSLTGALSLTVGSFLYGIFHAVGPGHGKAIISAYVLANERQARRGVALAFLAAFFQAVTAIVLVGVLAIIFNATGLQMQALSNQLETISSAVIMLLGAWLIWQQLSHYGLSRPAAVAPGSHAHHDHEHTHDHAHSSHGHHGHGHDGHAHLPTPDQLDGDWSWGRALWLAAAVGLRPCSGAIIVLVFAFSLGVFWIGVASTFAMALGTAITVSVLAAMAAGSRSLAGRMTAGSGGMAAWIEPIGGIGASALVFVLGLLFFIASLTPHPFQ